MEETVFIPHLGTIGSDAGFRRLEQSEDGAFHAGQDGVRAIVSTGDGKVQFIAFAEHTLAYVKSALAYPAYMLQLSRCRMRPSQPS